ncbi:hypothetical protein PCE1_002845 [Barthelona sp. PCE]
MESNNILYRGLSKNKKFKPSITPLNDYYEYRIKSEAKKRDAKTIGVKKVSSAPNIFGNSTEIESESLSYQRRMNKQKYGHARAHEIKQREIKKATIPKPTGPRQCYYEEAIVRHREEQARQKEQRRAESKRKMEQQYHDMVKNRSMKNQIKSDYSVPMKPVITRPYSRGYTNETRQKLNQSCLDYNKQQITNPFNNRRAPWE